MTSSQRFGIETVRQAVRERVAETSLRAVADEVPMSFSGLRFFLRGGTPQPATRAKLVAWFSRSRRTARVSAQDVDAALDLLAAYIAEGGSTQLRERRRRRVLSRLET